jgi:Protein of unknown function (DUF2946)
VLNKTRLRAAIFVALALIALQSFMPLAGELLAKNGWISSASMQVVCSQSGLKFVKTTDLSGKGSDQGNEHAVKCPWCQLGEPAVLPTSLVVTFTAQRHTLAALPRTAPALPSAPWLQAPARAPPRVHAHFA